MNSNSVASNSQLIGGTVPFVELGRQHAPIRDALAAAFSRVIDTSGFVLGEEVQLFEEEFAAYCGVDHCIGVNSGTAALTLAMLAAGIGPGDEVIVPAHTFIASALGVIHAGATPVLCDVRNEDGLIDLESARAAVGRRTAAILAVQLYGEMCDMEALEQLAQSKGLALFEDAAQAHGATYRDQRAGSFGTAAAFSFYPSKNLGALGDGGGVCTNDSSVAAHARMLRDLGKQATGEHLMRGYNERLDGLQAAFLRIKLHHLDGWNHARREHAALYRQILEPPARSLGTPSESMPSCHLFPVRIPRRDAVREGLAKCRVGSGIHYSPPLHQQPALQGEIGAPERYPVSEAWAAEELSLPMFAELEADEVQRVAEACNAAMREESSP